MRILADSNQTFNRLCTGIAKSLCRFCYFAILVIASADLSCLLDTVSLSDVIRMKKDMNDSNTCDCKILSILIPVYNEQEYLPQIVQRVLAAPIPDSLRKELIIVDDASKDGTADVLQELATTHPEIRVFHQPKNNGKGAAIRRATQEMTGDFAIFQDADLEYDPADYSVVLKPLVEGLADVVYGSRFATREIRRIVHYHHKLGNLFLTHLSNFFTGLDLTDMETGYKAFKADLIKSIPIRSNRFGMEPELTAKLAKRKAVFYEVPISYHGRNYGEGKKIGWKDGVSAIWTILKYWIFDDSHV